MFQTEIPFVFHFFKAILDTTFNIPNSFFTRDMCVPYLRIRITRDMCFPYLGTHISRDMCFPYLGTHISRDMCFPYPGTHFLSQSPWTSASGFFNKMFLISCRDKLRVANEELQKKKTYIESLEPKVSSTSE